MKRFRHEVWVSISNADQTSAPVARTPTIESASFGMRSTCVIWYLPAPSDDLMSAWISGSDAAEPACTPYVSPQLNSESPTYILQAFAASYGQASHVAIGFRRFESAAVLICG